MDSPSLPDASVLPFLSEERTRTLGNLAYAPEEKTDLEQQIAQAMAMRDQQSPQRMTSQAAMYDGIGNLVRNIGSFAHENVLRGQVKDLRSQQKTGSGDYIQELIKALRAQSSSPQAPAAPGRAGPDPFGIGTLQQPQF